jgi:hypothetical protein
MGVSICPRFQCSVGLPMHCTTSSFSGIMTRNTSCISLLTSTEFSFWCCPQSAFVTRRWLIIPAGTILLQLPYDREWCNLGECTSLGNALSNSVSTSVIRLSVRLVEADQILISISRTDYLCLVCTDGMCLLALRRSQDNYLIGARIMA